MENQTFIREFHLVSFFNTSSYTSLTASVFFFLYIFGLFINSVIITVICIDDQLHTPMYLFLCNLALVDICYTTTTVPKLLYMLLSGDNTVSFTQCLTQIYFYISTGSTEDLLIFIMAYDRYVAICHPLHYHSILNKKKCLLLASGNWISGCLNSFVLTILVFHMSFCHSHTIHQFCCDAKALFNISCGGTEEFYAIICLDALLFGFFPVMFSILSYVKIIRIILQIKSKDGRKKAFSTCSSHLIIIIMYYTTCLSMYMMPKSKYSDILDPVFAVLYSVVTPMVNPLIYSVRNKDVKRALMSLLGVNVNTEQICHDERSSLKDIAIPSG